MIKIRELYKSYDSIQVLSGLSLDLDENHILAILGKSGCGKSTLLKILAGLEMSDQGDFLIEGRSVLAWQPQERAVVYLSQEPLLFPHMTVRDNLGFGLRVRKYPEAEIMFKVEELAAQLGLQKHLDKHPNQLSGGQKQRVNFGRSIIINPKVLLLDEPFGSLDTQTREEMQHLFLQLARTYSITGLFVTHDIKEALLMGDRIALMKDGRMHIYPDKEAFVMDQHTGAQKEIDFWRQFIRSW